MRVLLRIFRQQAREMTFAALLAGASLGAAVGLLATSAWLISMASTRPPVLVLEVAIVSVRFFGLSRGFLKYASRILEHNSALKVQTSLRVKIYEKLSRLLPADYSALHRGNLLSQIINDVELVQDLWLRIASPWLSALVSGAAGVTIVHWLLPACGNFVALTFLAALIIIPFIATLSSGNSTSRKLEGELFDQIMQIAESAPESLIFNYDQKLLIEVATQQAKITEIELINARRSGFASAFYFLALGATIAVSLWYASQGALAHHLAGINIAVIALVPLAIFDGLSSLPAAFSQLRQVLGAVANIEPLLQNSCVPDVEVRDLPSSVTLTLSDLQPILEGATLKELSASVTSGKTLLITGRSGAGKSSLINALLGLIPYSGEILLNGDPLRSSDAALFSTLLQDDYLFGTSIRENLKIAAPTATDEEIFQVLDLVELKDFVVKLPDGLATMIGPLGFNFSGGEKQRLRLARVLLRDTPIFILDEPYEFLDSQMVRRISARVSKRLSDRAVLIVSHLPLEIEAERITL